MPGGVVALALLVLVSACGGGEGGNTAANEANEAALTGEDQLTSDPGLADEAAADEAADMNVYGGNAAAGETSNAAAGVASGGGGNGS
jgi:hypothetical protein